MMMHPDTEQHAKIYDRMVLVLRRVNDHQGMLVSWTTHETYNDGGRMYIAVFKIGGIHYKVTMENDYAPDKISVNRVVATSKTFTLYEEL